MRRIVFLFGAGASFGAGSILPERPPLGYQLHGELTLNYPGSWGRLPDHIAKALSRDFEAGMRLIYNELGGAIPQLMREMAIYFIQFRPANRSSLYCRLIQEIQVHGLAREVMFSTLNYECVLDLSIAEAGFNISYFDSVQPDAVPLWKLHGSCNMFSEGVQAGQGVSYGTGVTWEGGIRALPTADAVIQHCLVETGLAPVMCLYMEGKPLNVSPSAIRQVQAQWAEAAASAQSIVCVGVRPLPADDHIWTPLHKSEARLHFVGDQPAFESWSEGRAAPTVFIASRFDEGYHRIIEVLSNHAHQ